MIYLQGRVRFPIGGIVRERENAGLGRRPSQDLVRFQNQQYSLDRRRWIHIMRYALFSCCCMLLYRISRHLNDITIQVLIFIFRRKWYMDSKTKRITTTAMLCAVAYVVVVVGRVPVVLFLKYDPKDIIITLGGLIWGPMTSLIVSVIVSLIEMVTISENGVLGCIMNIISTCSFAWTASVIYKKKRTLPGAVTGLVTGSLMMVLVMLLWNYLITPIYMGYPREAVAELLVPAFLPFNLLKAGLNAGFTFLLYKPVTTALRKAGYISGPQNVQGRKPVGLWLLSGVIVITCILLILSLNGII